MKKLSDPVPVRVLSIHCDRCDRNMSHGTNERGEVEFYEGTTVKMAFGYGSRYDMQTWEFDLCDDCAVRLKQDIDIRPAPDTNATVTL